VSIQQVLDATEADLLMAAQVPQMAI